MKNSGAPAVTREEDEEWAETTAQLWRPQPDQRNSIFVGKDVGPLLPICPIYLGSWRKSLQNAPLTIRLETRILVPRTFAEKANCLVNGLNCPPAYIEVFHAKFENFIRGG